MTAEGFPVSEPRLLSKNLGRREREKRSQGSGDCSSESAGDGNTRSTNGAVGARVTTRCAFFKEDAGGEPRAQLGGDEGEERSKGFKICEQDRWLRKKKRKGDCST